MIDPKYDRLCLVFLTLLMCVSAFMQNARAQGCTKDPDDIRIVRDMKDVGIDYAVVVADHSMIYAQPDYGSKALLQVKRANILALVKRGPVSSWYRVVEIDSATEGWVNDCDVIIKLTTHPETGPALEEERLGTTADPELNISNLDPSTSLNLRLNGTLYVIPAKTTKTFTLKPGKYEFYGYSPGVRPAFGSDTFKAGSRYRWTFEIVNK
jgi:hypothetical protein